MRKRRKMKVVQDKSLLFCYHIVHEILLLFENEQNGLGHRKGEEMNSCAILLRNIMENPDINSKIVKKIGKDDSVGEIQDFGEWIFVYYPNTYPDFTYGYVRKSKLKKNIRHPFENIDLFN